MTIEQDSHIIFRAVWGDRPETPALAAERLDQLFSSLTAIDTTFKTWFKTVAKPKTPLFSSRDDLRLLLEKSSDDFGMSLEARTAPLTGIGVKVLTFMGSPPFAGDVQNALQFDVHILPPGARQISFETAHAIALKMIEFLDPSYLDVASDRFLALAADPKRTVTCPAGGWIGYARAEPSLVFRDDFSREDVAGGVLAASTKEPFNSSNREHLSAGMALNEAFRPIRDHIQAEVDALRFGARSNT